MQMKQSSVMHTILVVDDNPTNLGTITTCLEERGYKASVATDGEIALTRAKYLHPDLILLDVVLPGIDGFETCRRLQAEPETQDIPIIFMTALTSMDDKVHGFRAGGVDYITKPLQQEELLARVATHLRIRELMQNLQAHTIALAKANVEIRSFNEHLNAENTAVKADLQQSEHRYKTLVDQISEGHFVLQDECFVFANHAFCEMHGYRLEDVLRKNLFLLVDPQSQQDMKKVYERSHQDMTLSHLFEYMRLTQDHQSLPTEMTIKTTYHEDTCVTIGVCRDITARIAMEQKIREAERMTHIGRITTSLSHEIRNPLSAIKMHLQMLEEYKHVLDEGARLNLTLSIKEVTRLENILGQLLDFARPLRLNYEASHINRMISSCVDLFKAQFEQKDLEISCRLDPDIPTMHADEERLVQVIMNLLLNAFEASPQQGKIRISSQYHPYKDPPICRVSIEDEGSGISEKNARHLFEPFFTTKKRGTGLGLTNARHIIEAHGGHIEFENRDPQGAIFSMWFPI